MNMNESTTTADSPSAEIALILGTAGHIDHGKTALIHALTGKNTDRLPEEQKRGITIELGFAQLHLEPFKLGIVDVPGHEKFIRNMLSGATGLDLAMLIVAADDSVKPQTLEHLEILRYLDIAAGIIVITKTDLVDDELLELVEEEIRELCKNTFLQDAPVVHTSAQTGAGIDQLKQTLRLQCQSIVDRQINKQSEMFRLAIDRSFTLDGHGTIVTGSVTSGQLNVDDQVTLEPSGDIVRVRSLQNHDQSVDSIVRGERAAINLAGIKPDQIQRGMELASAGFLQPHKLLSVSLTISDSAQHPLKNHSRTQLHIGTANVPLSVKLLDTEVLYPGETGLAQLALDHQVVCTWNQPFVLRLESPVTTIAGGRILQPRATRIAFDDQQSLQFLGQLAAANSDVTRVEAAIFLAGLPPTTTDSLELLTGVADAEQLVTQLLESGTVFDYSHSATGSNTQLSLVHPTALRRIWPQVQNILQKEHDRNPLKTNLAMAPLKTRLAYLGTGHQINQIFSYFQQQGQLTLHSGNVTLKGQGPQLTKNERKLLATVVQQIRQAGINTLLVKEIESQAGAQKSAVLQLLQIAVANHELVEISPTYFIHSTVLQEIKQLLRHQLEPQKSYTMSEIRSILDTTRKYAVPLCEYFDRIGFTARNGDQRQLCSEQPLSPES
jgi:selenocysteine-specific elongation factor